MTTEAAARQYLAEHQAQFQGQPVAVFNPSEKPVDELPVIYGFNNGGSSNWLHAQLISQDGEPLGSHVCSDEGYMPYDLGIIEGTRDDRHDGFKKHYPDGYRMQFVPSKDIKGHAGLNAAFAAHKAKATGSQS